MAKATRRGWRGPGRAAQTRGLLAPARDPPLAVPTKTPLSARHTPADACMHPRCQSSQPPGGSFSPPPSSPGATEVPGHSATCPRSSNLEVKEWESELVRKGTPLASRVAQGVSGPSSSCVWNARAFADPDMRGFPCSSVGKEPACQCRTDAGSIPGSGRSPAEGNGNPLQYYCLDTATPVHRPQRPARSTHSSTRGLRPPEQLERPAALWPLERNIRSWTQA